MIFLTALITGLLSSLHCVGMCGPIALATPIVGNTSVQKISGKFVYNLGRVITYVCYGAVFGLFGAGIKIAGFQQGVSIGVGIIILVIAFTRTSWMEKIVGNFVHRFTSSAMGRLFKQQTYSASFLIGLMNGLLPCGFVYLALLGAISTQSVVDGMLFMFLFGVGTIPLMFIVSIAGSFINHSFRGVVRKVLPFYMVLMGALFIVRGLNLGIPYLSPQIDNPNHVSAVCGDSSHFNLK